MASQTTGVDLRASVFDAIAAIGSSIVAHPQNGALRERLQHDPLSLKDFGRRVVRCAFELLIACMGDEPSDVSAVVQRALAPEVAGARTIDTIELPGPWAIEEDAARAAASSLHTVQCTDPREIGAAYEATLDLEPHIDWATRRFALHPSTKSARHAHGVFYTPDALVQHLLDVTLEPVVRERLADTNTRTKREDALLGVRVCDPAAGCGAFLVAAAHRLAQHLACERTGDSVAPTEHRRALRDVIRHCIFAMDIDPTALDICRGLLWLAMDDRDAPRLALDAHVRVGDALRGAPAFAEMLEGEPGFDVVIGNPPFLNQLEAATARERNTARDLAEATDGIVRGYADTASAFLLIATELAAPGGRVSLVQPQSFLVAKDVRPVRRALLERASLTSLWVANEHIFEGASVFTCAPTLQVGGPRNTSLTRYATGAFDTLAPLPVDCDGLAAEETWGHLGASAQRIPTATTASAGTIADIAGATADFRDQYYGLQGFLLDDDQLTTKRRADDESFPRIATSGLIDLAHCKWGDIPTRILKTSWNAPRIDRRRMERDGSLGPWITARLVPKVLLATQTRIIEAFVDEHALFVPSTPVITVVPKDPARLWHVAAALASPVCTAVALQKYAGAALHADAIKLSAKQTLTLPLPTSTTAWDESAGALRDAQCNDNAAARKRHLEQFASASIAAYELNARDAKHVLSWWRGRCQRAGIL